MMQVIVKRKSGIVKIEIPETPHRRIIRLSIEDAYRLSILLMQELDKTNPLLAEPE